MKTSFQLILATLAATAALVSCTKEITSGRVDTDPEAPVLEGSRVITVSFDTPTRTYLDTLQPKFENGDLIRVANGTDTPQICSVSVDENRRASFTTTLPGKLTAVYPESAAGFDTDGKTITGVLVSTVQSGTFADANICMAKMTDEKDESLFFENKTAIFRITPEAGEDAQYVEVAAVDFNIANFSKIVKSGVSSLNRVRVDVPETDKPDEYFVSILVPEGLTVGHLSFSDGTNVKTVTGGTADTLIKVNTIYSVTVELNSFAITCEEVTITGASFSVMKENAAVTEARAGEELKVEVICPNGYNVGGITVCDADDETCTVEVKTDGSFTMPEYAVTVSVTLELDESGGGTEMEHGGLLS